MGDADNDEAHQSGDVALSERLGGSSGGILNRVGEDLRRGVTGLRQSYILLIVVGVLVGVLVAPMATSLISEETEPSRVAVISLSGGIDGQSAAATVQRLEAARTNPSVEAIVLRVNSPGGGASASEQLYLTVARAAEEMPVVVSVEAVAASGAYYASLPADKIYTKPSSLVGSVGVIFVAPQGAPPLERLVVTGPAKETGGDLESWYYKIDAAKQAFVGAVMAQRGDDLSIPRSEVATAKMFSGANSVQVGLTDEIGGLQTAIQEAADRADLGDYQVVVREPNEATFVTRTAYTASPLSDKRLTGPAYFVGNGSGATGPNILLLAPSVAMQAFEDRAVTAQNVTADGPPSNESQVEVLPDGGEIDA